VTDKGRNGVDSDATGANFPWKPKSFADVFQGELVDKDGNQSSCEDLSELDAVGIYFSAHWCPPCRGFTPKLAESYLEMKAAGKKWEIVFASSDQDQSQYDEYLGEMPFKAFPFGDKRKDELNDMFDVSGIPTLVVVDPKTGKVITTGGRGMVDSDPKGADFPWLPKPLNELDGRCTEYINESAVLVAFDDSAEVQAALAPLAEASVAADKAAGKEQGLHFLWAGGDDLVDRVRQVCKVPNTCKLAILEVGEGCTYQMPAEGKLTAAGIGGFIDAWRAGTAAKSSFRD